MAAEITSLPVEGKEQYFILEHTMLRHGLIDAVRCLIFWYCHVAWCFLSLSLHLSLFFSLSLSPSLSISISPSLSYFFSLSLSFSLYLFLFLCITLWIFLINWISLILIFYLFMSSRIFDAIGLSSQHNIKNYVRSNYYYQSGIFFLAFNLFVTL